jgi:murein DD-endopeptidase MepM/ murein hydrolase activator NlpD
LSAVNVSCAVGVAQGQVIGYGGSTGNSTGPHLHFELRYNGGTINPWTMLQ